MSNRLRPDFGLDWDADCIQVRSTNLERTVDVYLPAQAQQEIIFYGQSALDELRPAVNLWTDAQRLAILLLRDCSELDWEDVKRIFNRTFCAELAHRGFFRSGSSSNGLTIGALQSQRSELRDSRHPVVDILMSTDKLSNLKSPWQETLRAIVFTASTLRPSLEVSFEIDRSKFPVKVPIDRTAWHKRKMRERADTEDSDESDACSTDTSIIRAAKRSKPTSTAKQRQSMPSRSARLPQRRAYVLERSHDGTSGILFRAYSPSSAGNNSGHEFRSALYINSPHPGWEDGVILMHATNHLNRTQMPTPFISTTPSLIWVVKLAKANGPSGRIAMIEPRALNPTAYCIAPLCARVKASGKANFSGYRGEFEYWAWQHVPSHAIIADTSVEEFLNPSTSPLATQLLNMIDERPCRTIQRDCKLLSDSQSTSQKASAIASLIKIFFPHGVAEHYVKDLIRNCIQCFGLWPDMDTWQSNEEFCDVLEAMLGLQLRPTSSRDVYDKLVLTALSGKEAAVGMTIAPEDTAIARDDSTNNEQAMKLGMLSPAPTPCRKVDRLGSILQDLPTPLFGFNNEHDQSEGAVQGKHTIWSTLFRRDSTSPLLPILPPSENDLSGSDLPSHPLRRRSPNTRLPTTPARIRGSKPKSSSTLLTPPDTDPRSFSLNSRLAHQDIPTKRRLVAVVVPQTPRKISRHAQFEDSPDRQYPRSGPEYQMTDKQHDDEGRAPNKPIEDASDTDTTSDYPTHVKFKYATLSKPEVNAAPAANRLSSINDDTDSFEIAIQNAGCRRSPEPRGDNSKRLPDYLWKGSPYSTM